MRDCAIELRRARETYPALCRTCRNDGCQYGHADPIGDENMVNMKTMKCATCGGTIFRLAGKVGELCHDECKPCRKAREDAEAEEQNHEIEAEERRQLENEEMARHFEKHPHG